MMMKKKNNKKVLIIGCMGYLGSALSDYLIEKNYKCEGIDTGFFSNCNIYKEKKFKIKKKSASQVNEKDIKDLEELKIKFVSKNGTSKYPFWDLINGPIEDAVWHSGQLVSFRRSSGNPMNPKVNFLTGKVRD